MAIRTDMLPGDVLAIGDVRVTLERKGGHRARLSIHAPDGIRVVKLASVATDDGMFDPAYDTAAPATK